jgi:hypothetical protein
LILFWFRLHGTKSNLQYIVFFSRHILLLALFLYTNLLSHQMLKISVLHKSLRKKTGEEKKELFQHLVFYLFRIKIDMKYMMREKR